MKSEFMIVCLLLSAMAMQTAFGDSALDPNPLDPDPIPLDPDRPTYPGPPRGGKCSLSIFF